jgi:toxin CcdB
MERWSAAMVGPRQFDIVRDRASDSQTLLLILQSDFAGDFPSVVVAPLVLTQQQHTRLPRLHRELMVGGQVYVAQINRLAAIDRRDLGVIVGNAETEREALISALDLLFTGF